MNLVQEDNNYISPMSNYGGRKVLRNSHILLCGKSGFGKSLSAESLAEEYFNEGYVVIFLHDPKSNLEAGMCMFEPKEGYHLDQLEKVGKEPRKMPTKIYHPFTFSIPKNIKLPDINFFTFDIKDMDRADYSILLEAHSQNDAVSLLIQGTEGLKKEDGIYELVHYLKHKIKRVEKAYGDKKITQPDWEGFGLDVAYAGTVKDIGEINSMFLPFKRDYFLTSSDCELNLNVQDILNDNKHYHVFTTSFIKDQKMRDFVTFHLFNLFMKYRQLTKYPVCFVIEEVRFLVPQRSEGYKIFLANALRDKLTSIRNIGQGGNSTICTSQVLTDIDDSVANSFTETFIGNLGGVKDILNTSKALKYGKDTVEQIMSLPECTYLWKDNEGWGPFTALLPSHAHKEEHYDFFSMYKKYYPEQMKSYHNLYEEMTHRLKNEEMMRKDIVSKEMKEVKHDIDVENKRKEKEIKLKEKLAKLEGEKKDKTLEEKTYMESEILRLREQTTPPTSFNEIGALFQTTGQNIYRIYKKLKEAKSVVVDKEHLEEINKNLEK